MTDQYGGSGRAAIRPSPDRRARVRTLSAVRYANAESFFREAEERPTVFPDIALYHAAIAIELALTSYLLHVGFEDNWNARQIRHDLGKALGYANDAGLGFVSDELDRVVSTLTPYYKAHRIDDLAGDPNCQISALDVRSIVRQLLDAVRNATGHAHARRSRQLS